jgi:hypothetical protein
MEKIELQRRDFSKLTPAQQQRLERDLKALELMDLRESFAAPGGLLKFVRSRKGGPLKLFAYIWRPSRLEK